MLINLSRLKDFPFPIKYLASTFLVILAALITGGLWQLVDRPITIPLFLCAIVVGTWLGGIRVGIFTSLIAGVVIDFLYLEPYYSFSGTRDEFFRIALFLGEGILLSWLVERLLSASFEMRNSREELRELTKYQQTLREAEQKRIALELHDELGQALTGLKMDAHFLGEKIAQMDSSAERGSAVADVGDLSNRIDQTLGSVRRIVSQLRPSILDDFGLVAASEWQAKEFEKTTTIKCEFRSNVDELDLGSDSNTAVFRILQEALTNVARHAQAKSVSINFNSEPDGIVVTVADDGKGIGIDKRIGIQTLGLLGMRERTRLIGGNLDIVERSTGGTRIELRVPNSQAMPEGSI